MKGNERMLIDAAKEGMEYAYAPYSKFKVGAALMGESGNIYKGCNIENASFGATTCAERTAIFNAISQGERKFTAIAVVSSSKEFTYPCGICRQVLGEFMPKGEIILENSEGEIKKYDFDALLPYHFGSADLSS